MVPDDLKGKTGEAVALELFNEQLGQSAWWSLTRQDDVSFQWNDKRLGRSWRAKHGYLVALHEVSTSADARTFAKKNNIHLLSDGFCFNSVAEVFIQCRPLAAPELVCSEEDLYRVRTESGIEASVGYPSALFVRLLGKPAAEDNPTLPDPKTLTTLVIRNVTTQQVPAYCELMLYHLRRAFKGQHFSYCRLADLPQTIDCEDGAEESEPPKLVDSVQETTRPEAVAFFNRAAESEPIAGFLYLYRVLEACFDDVFDAEVSSWRKDSAIDSLQLAQRFRKLHQKEDKWALRQVLGSLVSQAVLDDAHNKGLVPEASADALAESIYLRRNSIAHGRRGQHDRVLVPFGVSLGDTIQQDHAWLDLARKLADLAMDKWLLQ